MLGWYLRQGWPRQLVILAVAAVAVPVLWTAIASYLFVDVMGIRNSYPRGDFGSYLVWWDYVLADSQTWRVHAWLAVSGAVAALPFGAFIARQVMDRAGSAKRPSLYGATGWASSEQMRQRDIDVNQRPF